MSPAAREYVGALCGEILSEWGAAHTVTLFASTGELSARLDREPEAFDLLLLDIQMEGMTGMELAHALRERGNQVSILFLTGCADYALEGYGVHPVHFLLKPVEREALPGRCAWTGSGATGPEPWCSAPAGGRCPCPRRTSGISSPSTAARWST